MKSKSKDFVGLSGKVHSFLSAYFEVHAGDLPLRGLYQVVMEEVERPLLITTLDAVSGNQKKASEILGMNRNTLRKKMQELGIPSPHKTKLKNQDSEEESYKDDLLSVSV